METNFLVGLHPNVVHFPIALIVTYSILEIVGIISKKEFVSNAALLILSIGVVTAFLAVLTGNQAFEQFEYWTEESKALLNEHQTFATYLMWSSFLVCSFRIYLVLKKKFVGIAKYLFILFAATLIFLVYQTGIRGGTLVKKYGVGTELLNSSDPK